MIRPIDRIFLSPRFGRELNRLHGRIQKLAKKKDKMFRQDAFHPSLKTHKLGGELKETYCVKIFVTKLLNLETKSLNKFRGLSA
ncbi:MAG: hypothetical protein HYT37_00320 [Candidatus Sungbacteria bacterium]|nr:hypothetical protein [Candidatus Sungbacteria bacterium]